MVQQAQLGSRRSRTGPDEWGGVPGSATVTSEGILYVEATDGIAVFDASEDQVGHLALFDADPITLLDGADGLIPIVVSDGEADWSELYVRWQQ